MNEYPYVEPTRSFDTVQLSSGRMMRQYIERVEQSEERGVSTREAIHQAGGDAASTVVINRVVRTGQR